MGGVLYVATDDVFLAELRSRCDKSALPECAARILVYRAASGETGFNIDAAGQALAYSLLKASCILTRAGNVVSFSQTAAGVEIDVLKFLGLAGANPVTFCGESPELQVEVAAVREYMAKSKRNSLLARYGKSEDVLTPPNLHKLWERETAGYALAIDWLYENCDRTMVWPTYGGGYGMHVVCIAKNHRHYFDEVLIPWSVDSGSTITQSVERSLLPAW